jgi:hypothetical protein
VIEDLTSNKFVTILCLEAVTHGPIMASEESKDIFVFQFCGGLFLFELVA